MATTTKNALGFVTPTHPITTQRVRPDNTIFQKLAASYSHYAEQQSKNRLLWYCMTLLVLPCAFMVPLEILMMHLTTGHIFYVGLLILMLFANVVAHVAQVSGRIFVPLYHATVAIMLVIPLVTYLVLG